jgi:hypothetical protein
MSAWAPEVDLAYGERQNTTPGSDTPYGRAALEDEARKVAEASPGNRNNQLNESALKMGSLVAGGVLDELAVVDALLRAALSCGLLEREARATIKSGMKKGMHEPRKPSKIERFTGHKGGAGREKERTEPPGPDDWESPIPLGSPRPGPMPEHLLPGPVGEMVKAVSAFTETPYELPAGIALGVVSACVQGKVVVQVKPGYFEPLQSHVMPTLDSGCRKTAVVEALAAPIVEYEAEKARELEPEIKRVAAKNKAIDARIIKLNSEYARKSDASEREAVLLEIQEVMAEQEPALVAPRVFCQDVTPEHLAVLMTAHKGRMSIICDEGGFFDILAGRYSKNGAPNLDLFLKGHAGSALRVDRGSRDPVWIDNPALTLAMSPQPETIYHLAKQPGFRGRGVLARIWYLMPQSPLGFRSLAGPSIPGSVSEGYQRFIRGQLERPTPEDGPARLPLNRAAYSEWFNFSLHIESGLKPGGEFEPIKDWCGKLPGAAARMAGLIHTMNPASGHEISVETMSMGLELASVFLEHALFVFDAMGADDDLIVARKIMSWAERNGKANFTKQICFQGLRGSYPAMKLMEPGFKILEERNHLIIEKTETGGRPSYLCHINPILLKEWMS